MNKRIISGPSSKYRVLRIIDKINNKLFDESDIRTLLIEIRDYLPRDSIMRDIAHFIAHPEIKDRGIINQEISLFAYKVKRFAGIDKIPIKMKSINSNFYEMIIYGIKQLNKDININGKPINTSIAINKFNNRYKKNNKVYNLIEPISKKHLDELVDIIIGVFGTMNVKAFMTRSDLINILNDAISCLLDDFNKELVFINSTEIMICLLSVIQNVNFILIDKTRAFLRWEPYSFNDNGEMVDDISLFAYCEGPEYVNFSFCFISVGCKSLEYNIDLNEKQHIKKSFFAERNKSGKLYLRLTGEMIPFD